MGVTNIGHLYSRTGVIELVSRLAKLGFSPSVSIANLARSVTECVILKYHGVESNYPFVYWRATTESPLIR